MLCERCQMRPKLVEKGNRFCSVCKKQVLAELRQSGYLSALPQGSFFRSSDARENTRETKFGHDQ